MLCFVVVMQSVIMNSHEVSIHIHQGCFAGTVAIVRLPQCQWSKPDGYGKISQCITTTKHSKAKTVCIFLGIYCTCHGSANHLSPYCIFNKIICSEHSTGIEVYLFHLYEPMPWFHSRYSPLFPLKHPWQDKVCHWRWIMQKFSSTSVLCCI